MSPTSSLRLRIVAAVSFVTLALVGALLYQTAQYQQIARRQTLLTEGYLPLNLEVDRLRADQQRIASDLGRLLRQEPRPGRGVSSSAAIHSDRLRETVLEARVHGRQALRMANEPEELAVLHKAQASLARVEELVKAYQTQVASFQERLEAGAPPSEDVASELTATDRALEQEVDTLSQLLTGRVEKLGRSIDEQRRYAAGVAVGLAALGVVLAGVAVLTVLAALRPLERLTQQAQRLAAGDYGTRIEALATNEIGMLAAEFNAMADAIQERDRSLVDRAEELNRLSRYLGDVLDQLQDALLVAEGGVVTLVNPAAESRFRVARGSPVPEPLLPAAAEQGYHEIRHEGRRLAVRSGRFGDRGQLLLASDVTEQRTAEEALARSERLALVGQMLAQITHEVRNPLNALSLNAEMLSDELAELDPERTTEAWDLLATVSGEVERLTQVTAHYLQLARRPPARLAPTHLRQLIDDLVRLLDAELAQQHVQLTVEERGRLPAQRVDGGQLRQALLNVVRNATEAGATRLTLTLSADEEHVVIGLCDDGPGMDEDLAERAFDPFYSTKPTGTGLGLAITRQILEDHDGAVRVASHAPRGTTVELVLPRRDADDPDPELG